MPTLDTVAKIVVILAGLEVLGDGAVSTVQAMKDHATPSEARLNSTSSASAEKMMATLTNLRGVPMFACLQGKVTNKAGNSAETVVVCSGDIKPHSTVHIEAPFKVGAVLDLCNKAGAYGKVLDWSDCAFETVDKTAAAIP